MSAGPNRRAFLGTSLAAGAGAVLLGANAGFEAKLVWCARAVHPLALKSCTVFRGDLPPNRPVTLTLTIDGPEFERPRVIHQEALLLTQPVVRWDVRLAHNHPDLIPGQYTYSVTLDAGDRHLASSNLTYFIRPFWFGV